MTTRRYDTINSLIAFSFDLTCYKFLLFFEREGCDGPVEIHELCVMERKE